MKFLNLIFNASNDDLKEKEKKENLDIDPVHLMIWGIFLLLYVIYSTYNILMNDSDISKINLSLPNIVFTFFGIIMIVSGYQRERNKIKD